ncbi:hypothetical protein F4821DRAFT_258296 [Hypoxylon rubiginosum]|uniref:Uncharacterized protein n=1 Tax=Hypoxylon rubiginosum TaxID=110542 RepID=A0ACC0D6A0_9PEZI|nr:hypothetical protein F4821DRAFT_258296 [Hypoxylon rubiginosum]
MIRHPLQSAVGRTRPDLNRVADGIAASLRQFSISARRSASDDNDSQPPRPPTGPRLLRNAAAVNEVLSILDDSSMRQPRAQTQNQTPATSSTPRPITKRPSPNPPARAQGPNTITVNTQPRGGANRLGDDLTLNGRNNEITSAPQVIRGGFRGRGRGFRGGFGDNNFTPSDRSGGPPQSNNNFNRDDRPRRGRGRGAGGARGGGARGGRGGRGGNRRRREDGDRDSRGRKGDGSGPLLDAAPHVKAYLEQRETGETLAFNPSLTLQSLAGYGPAVATAGTPFGQGETALRQARIMGGGDFFHPLHIKHPDEVRAAWRDGAGVFVPPSAEARQWTDAVLERMVEKSGKPFGAPEEVKQAVLEDALLGKYEGPKYAELNDTAATIRSYVKRDGTWNAQAERGIEAKVMSLLGQRRGGAKAPAAARAKA